MSHYINLWQEAEKYWQANHITREMVIRALIEMEIIDQDSPKDSGLSIYEIVSKGKTEHIVDFDEALNEEWYENGDSDFINAILAKVNIQDYKLNLEYTAKGYSISYWYSIHYQGRDYPIDGASPSFIETVELYGASINDFLTQINHYQRLYCDIDNVLKITVANYKKFEQLNPTIHLPLRLLSVENL